LLAGRLASSPAPTLFISLAAIGLTTVLMGLSNSYAIWLFARWLAGLCSALVLVVISTHFVKHLTESGRPDLLGWVFAGVGGGTVIVGLASLLIMVTDSPSWWGWRSFGVMTLAATVAILFLVGGPTFFKTPGKSTVDETKSPLDWRIILPYGAMGAGYIIPATYLPIMAQQTMSSPLVFGWSWPAFGLAASLSTLLAAWLHTFLSNRQIWISSQLIMAVGLFLPAVWPHILSVVIGGICVGGTFVVITMAGIKEAHRIGGLRAQHHVAAMTSSFAFGQIIGPLTAGWMYHATNSFTYPLMLGSVVLVATLAPMLRRTAGSRQV
jgi:MFS family permease